MEVGAHDGLVDTVLTSTLQSPQYVSAVSRFDLVILVDIRLHYTPLCLSVCKLEVRNAWKNGTWLTLTIKLMKD